MLSVLLKSSSLGLVCGLAYGYGFSLAGVPPLVSAGFGVVVTGVVTYFSIKDSK